MPGSPPTRRKSSNSRKQKQPLKKQSKTEVMLRKEFLKTNAKKKDSATKKIRAKENAKKKSTTSPRKLKDLKSTSPPKKAFHLEYTDSLEGWVDYGTHEVLVGTDLIQYIKDIVRPIDDFIVYVGGKRVVYIKQYEYLSITGEGLGDPKWFAPNDEGKMKMISDKTKYRLTVTDKQDDARACMSHIYIYDGILVRLHEIILGNDEDFHLSRAMRMGGYPVRTR